MMNRVHRSAKKPDHTSTALARPEVTEGQPRPLGGEGGERSEPGEGA